MSDAGVFTELIQNLGVEDCQLNEVYLVDAESLRALAPVHAVIFLFKYGSIDRRSKGPLDGEFDRNYQDKGIFFARQTVQNACATQAVLNSLLNKLDQVKVGSELLNIHAFVNGFDAETCGDTISNSDRLRAVHNLFSAPKLLESGSRSRPEVNERDNGLFHFVTYLNINNTIYELDGLKEFPIRHDTLENADDFYRVLPAVLERRINKYVGEIRFSLLAITNDKLKHAQEIGDLEGVQQELQKREMWARDNKWRRHNYTNLIFKLLQGISEGASDQEWIDLVQEAKRQTMVRETRPISY